MRKVIGEMDNLVAQLSSELKFIKNGMLPPLLIDFMLCVRMWFSRSALCVVSPSVRVSASLVVLKDLRMLATSVWDL